MLTIKIKYFNDKLEKVAKITKGNWIDLRAAEDVALKAGEFKLIPLGIAMELPRGYEAHVVPRSSTFKNYGIIQVNHQGVVDGPDRETGEGDRFVFLGGNFTFQDDLRLERCRQARYDDQKKNGDKSGVSHSCGV